MRGGRAESQLHPLDRLCGPQFPGTHFWAQPSIRLHNTLFSDHSACNCTLVSFFPIGAGERQQPLKLSQGIYISEYSLWGMCIGRYGCGSESKTCFPLRNLGILESIVIDFHGEVPWYISSIWFPCRSDWGTSPNCGGACSAAAEWRVLPSSGSYTLS